MADGPAKVALALRIFGKSGEQLIPFLNEGAAGIAELMARAEELGLTISQETAAAADQFNDSLNDLKQVSVGLAYQFTASLLPALNALVETFKSDLDPQLEKSQDAVSNWGDTIGIMVGALIDGTRILFFTIGTIAEVLQQTAGAIAVFVKEMATLDFGEANRVLEEYHGDLAALGKEFATFDFAKYQKALSGLGDGAEEGAEGISKLADAQKAAFEQTYGVATADKLFAGAPTSDEIKAESERQVAALAEYRKHLVFAIEQASMLGHDAWLAANKPGGTIYELKRRHEAIEELREKAARAVRGGTPEGVIPERTAALESLKQMETALEQQIATFGKSEAEVVAYSVAHGELAEKIKAGGEEAERYATRLPELTARVEALREAAAGRIDPAEAMKSIQDMTKAIDDQAASYFLSGVALEKYRIQTGDLAATFDATGDSADALTARYLASARALEAVKLVEKSSAELEQAMAKDAADAAQVVQDSLTPHQQFVQEMVRLSDLLRKNEINEAEWLKGAEDAKKTFEQATREMNAFAVRATENVQDILADGLKSGFDEGFDGILDSFKQLIADMIAEALAADILKGLFGAGGIGSGGGLFGDLLDFFRAEGGPVAGGKTYVVGERGPELFAPAGARNIFSQVRNNTKLIDYVNNLFRSENTSIRGGDSRIANSQLTSGVEFVDLVSNLLCGGDSYASSSTRVVGASGPEVFKPAVSGDIISNAEVVRSGVQFFEYISNLFRSDRRDDYRTQNEVAGDVFTSSVSGNVISSSQQSAFDAATNTFASSVIRNLIAGDRSSSSSYVSNVFGGDAATTSTSLTVADIISTLFRAGDRTTGDIVSSYSQLVGGDVSHSVASSLHTVFDSITNDMRNAGDISRTSSASSSSITDWISNVIRDGDVSSANTSIANSQLSIIEYITNLFRKMGGASSSALSYVNNMFRADGGFVAANNTYIVGERGPELFKPSVSGTIIPNTKLSGSSDAGGLFRFVGGLFAGARAMGGSVAGGMTYLVGERGPELFAPGGMATPNAAAGVTIVQNNYISGSNLGPAEMTRILDDNNRKMKSEFIQEIRRGAYQ
jgi:uncharacterized protein with PhoU and TrkA domain